MSGSPSRLGALTRPAEALKVLEWARVLTWRHRIARIRVRERDLFGQWASRWRVTRTSRPAPQSFGP
jgi:hypothetical protein